MIQFPKAWLNNINFTHPTFKTDINRQMDVGFVLLYRVGENLSFWIFSLSLSGEIREESKSPIIISGFDFDLLK